MRHDYWRPGAVADIPYDVSPSVQSTPSGLQVVDLIVGSTSKGDRARGFVEANFSQEIRPQQRTDTSNESALLTHPLRIARHKAQSFREEPEAVAFADDVARIIDGEIRYKPSSIQSKEELKQHLSSLLCQRQTPLIMEVVNAQALHGKKGNVAAVDRFQVKFSEITPIEIEYYLDGLAGLETKNPDTVEQLKVLHAQMEETFTGILTVQELEQLAEAKQLSLLKKVIDGILLEDPLFQKKIQTINGKDRRDPEFPELLRGLFEASLGLPIRLREMVSQYHQNASGDRELFAFPINNAAGYIHLDERELASSPVIRSQAVGPHASKLGEFRLRGHEQRQSVVLESFFAQPEVFRTLWQYLLTMAELTAAEQGYSRLETRAESDQGRFLRSHGFVPQGDAHYSRSGRNTTRMETYSRPFNLGTR